MPPLPPDILSREWGWDNVRRDVFQLVAWGYQMAEREIRQRHLEEDITGLLRKAINEKLDEELPSQFWHYSAKSEDPVDDAGAFGKDRPRIDILVECAVCRPRKRYRLEGKRCARNGYPISKYLAGVRTYIERRYASDAPEAGLLGLVQTDSPRDWKARLCDRLGSDSSLACLTSTPEVAVIPALTDMAASHHQRTDGSVIALYHAFLDCRSSAAQPSLGI